MYTCVYIFISIPLILFLFSSVLGFIIPLECFQQPLTFVIELLMQPFRVSFRWLCIDLLKNRGNHYFKNLNIPFNQVCASQCTPGRPWLLVFAIFSIIGPVHS